MLCSFFRNWIDTHELFPQVASEPISAVKNVRSCRRFANCDSQSFLNRIDGVFGHGAVRGPLSAHDADKAAVGVNLNDVVARNLFRAPAFSRADQWACAGEGGSTEKIARDDVIEVDPNS